MTAVALLALTAAVSIASALALVVALLRASSGRADADRRHTDTLQHAADRLEAAEVRLKVEEDARDQAVRELLDTGRALAGAVRDLAVVRADNELLWAALGERWETSDASDCPPRERLDGTP